MSEVKETLFGIGLAMILFYFILVAIVKYIDESIFNFIIDYGILFSGIVTILVSISTKED